MKKINFKRVENLCACFACIVIFAVILSFSCKVKQAEPRGKQGLTNISSGKVKAPHINVIKKISNDMVTVAAGIFEMGNDELKSATPKHVVYLSSFYISKYEVTYELWQSVKSWATKNEYIFGNDGIQGKDRGIETSIQHPVTSINWYDAVVWCNALSEMLKLTPAYYTEEAKISIYKDSSKHLNIKNEWVKWDADGYRLPTEAEFEYAMRNKGARKEFEYSGSAAVYRVAWYNYNSGSNTHPVGKKKPNELGTYDMSGNVWEWCWDWYSIYTKNIQSDPKGFNSGRHRVLRGGSWGSDDYFCEVSERGDYWPGDLHYTIGFRIARSNLK